MKLLLALSAAAGVFATRNHPIAGVISMLKELAVKAKQEGETEALAYTKYSHWCGNEIDSLTASKKKSEETIESLAEQITGFKAEIESLTDQIDALDKELGDLAARQAKADEMRGEENDLYTKNKGDLEATITAIQGALKGLKESKPAMTQVRALVKKAAVIASSAISHKQHKVIQAFLQQGPKSADEQGFSGKDRPDQLAKGDNAGHVADYTFKSGNVIELLKQLEADFQSQLVETEKAETNGVNGHDLAKQANSAAIKAAEDSKKAKEASKDTATTNLGEAEGAHDEEVTTLATTSKNLKDTTTTCTTFADEYEKRTTIREGEQTAIKTAIDVLSKATGLRTDTHEIAKRGADTEFVQLSLPKSDAMKKAITLIASAGKKANNGMVQRLAQQLRVLAGRKQMPGSQSPFAQINNMIQKMIFRLNKEQTDEDAHKAWCDTEIDKTATQHEEKTNQKNELTQKVNKLTATIEKTESKLSDLADDLAANAKYVKEETDMRAENKEENLKTISDAKEAQAALKQATAVLTQFYKESGAISSEAWEETAFIQAKPADPFEAGQAFQSTGEEKVMELLKTTTENYQMLQSDTEIAEAEEQSNFEADMNDKRIEKSQLEEDVRQNEMKKKRKTEENNKTKKMLKQTKAQLEALEQYEKDLTPSCIDGSSTYEERKGARDSEIGALKEALETLKTAFEKDVEASLIQKRAFMSRRM